MTAPLLMGPAVENQSAYVNAQIQFRAAFFAALEKAKDSPLARLVQEVSSDTAAEQHIFLGDLPGFKEWVGDREMGSLAAHKIFIQNRNWSNGVEVHRNQIEDDKLGLVMPRIQGLAAKALRHRATLIAELLLNGFDGTANFGKQGDPTATAGDGTCYDGSFMFSTSHSLEGGPEQSNTLTAKLSDTALEAAIQLMRGFRTYDGRDPLDITPTHLICGPSNEWTAKRLLDQEFHVRDYVTAAGGAPVAAMESNIHKGSLQLIVDPRIADYTGAGGTDYSKYWFVAALDEPLKPFIFQLREPISVAALTGWDSPEMFKRGVMQFGAQARYAVANYDWRLIVGSTGAA